MNHLTDMLELRANWLRKVRQFLDQQGLVEVQTPVLSHDTVVDRYIEPIPVDVQVQGQGQQRLWLQTSPEFCMKRLLAGGARAIYEITPVMRNGELGDRHNPEFTLLEWYRVGDDYQRGMDFLDQFSQVLLDRPPARRFTYRQAFIEYAGMDPFDGTSRLDDNELNRLFSERVEPGLASWPAAIVYDWPPGQAALAQIRQEGQLAFAERFELYVSGIELANGYHELTDPDELRRRNQTINQLRQADGHRHLPENSRLLEAMRNGLPECCGVALGFDRLLMLVSGAERIDQVLPFPLPRA